MVENECLRTAMGEISIPSPHRYAFHISISAVVSTTSLSATRDSDAARVSKLGGKPFDSENDRSRIRGDSFSLNETEQRLTKNCSLST